MIYINNQSTHKINKWCLPLSGSCSVDLEDNSFCFTLLFRTEEFFSVLDEGCFDVGFLV